MSLKLQEYRSYRAYSYRQKITRKSTLEYKLDYDEKTQFALRARTQVFWANGSPYLSGWGTGNSNCYDGIGLSWHDYEDFSKQQAVCRDQNDIRASSDEPWIRVRLCLSAERENISFLVQ